MARMGTGAQATAEEAVLVPGTTYYLSLHTADPGTTGASEVTGGSYARQAIQVNSSGVSTDAQNFTGMPALGSGTPYAGIWTAATAGTYIWGGDTAGLSEAIPTGATVALPVGAVTAAIA